MTQVRLGLLAPTSTGTGRRPSGSVEWRPTKRRTVGDDVVLPAPFTVGLADTPPVIEVAPTEPGWAWQVVERVQGGSPRARYVTVPDTASVVDYADLVEVDGSTLEPVVLGNAWWTQVTDAISAGLATKVNTSTYTAGLATKQDKATLGADVAAAATVRAAFARRISARSAPREAGLPVLMSSPPTLSAATVGWPASTIASAVFVPAIANALVGQPADLNTAGFSFRGGPWQQYGLTNPDYALAAPTFLHNEQPSFPYVEFLYYGQKFEFTYKGQGSLGSRVWVDGQLAEAGYTADTTQDGTGHTRIVTFTSVAWRRIRIDMYAPLYGVNIGPNDVVVPAPRPGEKLLVIHDSFGEGTGANFFGGYPITVAGMLGFAEVISLSQGGTGVLAVNSGLSRPKYRDRASDWSGLGVTSVLIGMSVNDDAFSTSALATELDLLLTAVQAIPGVRDVWIMGRPGLRGSDVATAQARDAALKPTADAHGVPYISLVSPDAIWTGEGHQGATTGSGSSDLLVWTDGTHPTQAGHDGIARTFVNRLLNTLPA